MTDNDTYVPINIIDEFSDDMSRLNIIFSSKDENGNIKTFPQHLIDAFSNIDIKSDEAVGYSMRIIQELFPEKEIGYFIQLNQKIKEALFKFHVKQIPLDDCKKKENEEKKEEGTEEENTVEGTEEEKIEEENTVEGPNVNENTIG